MGYYVAVLGSLLGVSTLFFNAYNIPKIILLWVGAGVLWYKAKDEVTLPALTQPVLIFLAAVFLAARLSVDPNVSFVGYYYAPFHGFLTAVICALLFFGAGMTERKGDLFRAMAWASFPLTGYAVLQVCGFDPLGWPLPKGRATSFLGNPVYLGACYAVILPAVMGMTIQSPKDQDRTLGLLASISCAIGLALAWSKGAVIASGCGIVVFGVLSRELPRKALLALPAFVFAGVWGLSHDLARLELWRISWRAFLAHPYLGWGPDTFLLAWRQFRTLEWVSIYQSTEMGQASAHNDIMQVAVTMGLLGLTAYGYLIYRTWKEVDENPLGAGPVVGGILAAAFIQAKVNPLPLPVLAIVAMAAGLLPGVKQYPGVWFKLAGVPLCVIGLILSSQFALADFHFRNFNAGKNINVALESLKSAINHNPNEQLYCGRAVEVLTRIGTRTKRSEFHQTAKQIATYMTIQHPYDPLSYDSLASVYWATGDYRNAYLNYSVASKLDPTFMLYLKARSALATLANTNDAKELRRRYSVVKQYAEKK